MNLRSIKKKGNKKSHPRSRTKKKSLKKKEE